MQSRGASWIRLFVQRTRFSKREAFESWYLTLPQSPGSKLFVSRRQPGIGSACRAGRRRHPATPDSGAMRQIEREVRTRLLAALAPSKSIHVFDSMTHATEVVRQRLANPYGKKAPGRAVEWNSTAPWMRAAGR